VVDYLTVQDIRDAGIAASVASNAAVLAAIKTWQSFVEAACQQWFEARSITMKLDGNDSDMLFFAVPIVSVEYLKANGSEDELSTDLYEIYNSRTYPDDRRNPRIKLIRSEAYRDIFVEPLTLGRLKFRKGRRNQEVKGEFGFIEDGVEAMGSIQFVTKANLIDGETFVLDDGVNSAVTFYFDTSATYVPGGGYDATNIRMNVSGDTTADDVAATAKTAINGVGSTLLITAGMVETGGLLRLENDSAGEDGNQVIEETVANTGFYVWGMAGGAVPPLITRALLKLVVEKLTNPVYPNPAAPVVPAPPVLGSILEEKTDGHSTKYAQAAQMSARNFGLSGITDDPEILDIIKMFKRPRVVAVPSAWSYA